MEKSPAAYLGYLLIRRAALLSDRFTEVLRRHGLTSRQFSALAVVASVRLESKAQLAREIVMTPQSVGTLIEVLEKRGFVTVNTDGGGGSVLTLEPAGERILKEAYESVDLLDREIRAHLGDQYESLRQILLQWGV